MSREAAVLRGAVGIGDEWDPLVVLLTTVKDDMYMFVIV